METYQESYHGKAVVLGKVSVAQCSDCHGYHDVRAVDDEASMVALGKNRQETCQQCHPGATVGFSRFMPHADPSRFDANPVLYVVQATITALLLGVFLFFGLHTLLWGMRELVDAFQNPRPPLHLYRGPAYVRFGVLDRIGHVLIAVTFIGLALTGAPLRFSQASWAPAVLAGLGGVETAGSLHRIFGAITLLYFCLHLIHGLLRLFPALRKGTFVKTMTGGESIAPRLEDFEDMLAHFRWFFFRAERPRWDRFTYWEKFDYWAIFWSIVFIGTSGLILWFPTVVTAVLPGEVINFAQIVHSGEALLAMAFIFGIHFFHATMRRTRYPKDETIFTGRAPADAYREERPREWERVEAQGRLAEKLDRPPSPALRGLSRAFIVVGWILGGAVLLMIVHGYLTAA
ncbi:MAG: hypothetical protein HC923_08260 [Myxococcales bacterium]|nr:hypothetical protein [Myxococcales bacterium]